MHRTGGILQTQLAVAVATIGSTPPAGALRISMRTNDCGAGVPAAVTAIGVVVRVKEHCTALA